VSGCLFVDAALPAPADATPVVPAELLDILRSKVIDGRLPPRTDWWDEADVAPLFPDPQTRAAVTAEQPRLPLAYYEQTVRVPAGWDTHPSGYLLFGPPYEEVAAGDGRSRSYLVGICTKSSTPTPSPIGSSRWRDTSQRRRRNDSELCPQQRSAPQSQRRTTCPANRGTPYRMPSDWGMSELTRGRPSCMAGSVNVPGEGRQLQQPLA
jgi:hypothetical protein